MAGFFNGVGGGVAAHRQRPRGLLTHLRAFVPIVLIGACKGDDADGLLPECRAYVNAYASCLTNLQGDDSAHARQINAVRASLRLGEGATETDRTTRQAKCANAMERLVCK
jgi:hypothetical protein